MKVLFMCTANSCRSILSEAVFNHLAPAGWRAVSAGSFPSGQVHPLSLKTLEQLGIATEGLASKGSEAFADEVPDIVITVCDQAAGEPCPVYFGPALKAHWGLEDPSHVDGDEAAVMAAFRATVVQIERRCRALLALSSAQIDVAHLQRIGQL
ncbi:arsenate reductase ArsC [Pseudomonas gingeri]|uniref:arsenate reductase ArsC n=1 Tax=Pseudomonas gingeri TaxID=117681 RepID=UPI0015A39D0E|nr:arsenate reductase ArsC [Pseudomonas gingeri]NWA25905.1 arsenate reductase ArsC [Pseudomonas gingeri]NWD67421.1 arsenate reductase ArsC [Pseudomonas gingeri]NWD74236.1 arsenate reductase ArsC [Pseudomonas gingeri]